jgi:hypothetical protein
MGPSSELASEVSTEGHFLNVFRIGERDEEIFQQYLEVEYVRGQTIDRFTVKAKEVGIKCELDPHVDDEIQRPSTQTESDFWSRVSLRKKPIRIIDTGEAQV